MIFHEEDQRMQFETPGGNVFIISDKDKGISMKDQNGNKLVMNQDGIILNSNFTRYGARVNLDGNRGIFKFGLNFNPSVIKEKRVNSDGTYASAEGGGVVSSALHYSPIWPVYNPDGSYSFAQNSWNGDAKTTLPNGTVVAGNNQTQAWNPVALAQLQKFDVNSSRILGNVFAEVRPVKDIRLRTSLGVDFNMLEQQAYNGQIPGDRTIMNVVQASRAISTSSSQRAPVGMSSWSSQTS